MTIAVKKHAQLDNKFLKSCPVLLDFFTLCQIFYPGLQNLYSLKYCINLKLFNVWSTLYLDVYVLDSYKLKYFVFSAKILCVSHLIDICTVGIKTIKNMHTVSTDQIADILHFNYKAYWFGSKGSKATHSTRTGDFLIIRHHV